MKEKKNIRSLEQEYIEIFGPNGPYLNSDDDSSLVQPGLGEIVDSFVTSFLEWRIESGAQLESNS